MINQHLIEPFARTYRFFDDREHAITDEVLRPTMRQRVGLRLIHIGHQLRGPVPDRAAA